jgi:hypothetical protein
MPEAARQVGLSCQPNVSKTPHPHDTIKLTGAAGWPLVTGLTFAVPVSRGWPPCSGSDSGIQYRGCRAPVHTQAASEKREDRYVR